MKVRTVDSILNSYNRRRMKPQCFEQLLDCAFDLFLYLPRVSPGVSHILSLQDIEMKYKLETSLMTNDVRR